MARPKTSQTTQDDSNPIQDRYDKQISKPDREFLEQSGIDSEENASRPNTPNDKDPDPEYSLEARENAGSFNPQSDYEDAREEIGPVANALYRPDTFTQEKRKSKRKRNFVIAGMLTTLLGGGIAGLILMSGFKIDFIYQAIESRVYAAAEYAIGRRAERLLARYLSKHTFRALKVCPGVTIARDCTSYAFSDADTFAGRLFQAWRNAGIEQRLFDDYGIEIKYNSANNSYSLKTPRDVIDLPEGDTFDFDFKTVSKRQIVDDIMDAMKKDSRWRDIMFRRSVRKMVGTKYGAKWCFFACDTRDKIDNLTVDTRTKFKTRIIERVVLPLNERYALYFFCMLTNCIDTNNRQAFEDFLRDRNKLSKFASPDIVDDIAEEVAQLIDNGDYVPGSAFEVVFRSMIEKIIGKTGSKIVFASVPIVNAVYLFDTAAYFKISLIDNNALGNLVKDQRELQYVKYANDLRTHIDEFRDGQLSLDEYGAYIEEWDGMEKSLLWQNRFSNSLNKPVISTVSPIQSWLTELKSGNIGIWDFMTGGVGGAANGSGPDDCRYGPFGTGPVLAGDVICPQRKIVDDITLIFPQLYDYMTSSSVARSLPGNPFTLLEWYTSDVGIIVRGPVHWIFATFEGLLDSVSQEIIEIAQKIPFVSDILDAAKVWFSDMFKSFFAWVFPPVATGEETGREAFELAYGGEDAKANDFVKGEYDPNTGGVTGLGAPPISDENLALVREEMQQEHRRNFESMTLFARLFSFEEPSSLVAQALIQTPAASSNPLPYIASWFANPLRSIAGIGQRSALAFMPAAYAQAEDSARNPFGNTQYGFPLNDPLFDADPDTITPEYCTAMLETWKNGWRANPTTGIWEYTTANPCLLEEVATDVLKSWYTNEDDGGVGQTFGGTSIIVTPTGSTQTGLVPHPTIGLPDSRGYYSLPQAPNGEYSILSDLNYRCGAKTLIDFIYTIGLQWETLYPSVNQGIAVRDLNNANISYSLGHRTGIDVDINLTGIVPMGDQKTIDLLNIIGQTGVVKQILIPNNTVISANVVDSFNATMTELGLSTRIQVEPQSHPQIHITLLDNFAGIPITNGGCGPDGVVYIPALQTVAPLTKEWFL